MIEFKGRNGYARLARFVVLVSEHDRETTYVELFSKRTGDAAPIVLTGPRGEIASLLRALADGVAEGRANQEVA